MFVFVALPAALFLVLESFDRLSDSTPSFALAQLGREISGDRSPVEVETLAFIDKVATDLDIPLLRLTRVGLADQLSHMDFSARFNPTTFRIAVNPDLHFSKRSNRRDILLHEIGHAVAFASLSRPRLDLKDAQANAIIEQSLLSNQMFQESFADTFSILWTLRAQKNDPKALKALSQAVADPVAYASPAHETTQALRLLKLRLREALGVPASKLVPFLAGISSQASALTIAQMGAEREAACYMGARGIARFALDFGYQSFYLPWEMAQTYPIADNDPMRSGLSALSNLRGKTVGRDPWSKSLKRARPAIEQALAATRDGASPKAAALVASRWMSLTRQNALPREIDATAFAARLSSSSRSGWRASAASIALNASEKFLPTPTYGCKIQSVLNTLR